MTRLLVSVRSAEEALAAMAGGADILDVKEPSRGSLGAADEHVWREVVAAAKSEGVPVSIALGELNDLPSINYPPGVQFAKVGLANLQADADWRERWLAWRQSLPTGLEAVAVAYVDRQSLSPPPQEILQLAAETGTKTLLFDTFDKAHGSLFDHASLVWLRGFRQQVHETNLSLALAGSLRKENIPLALELQPEILAVRTAACDGGREGEVSASLVRELCEIMGQLPSSV